MSNVSTHMRCAEAAEAGGFVVKRRARPPSHRRLKPNAAAPGAEQGAEQGSGDEAGARTAQEGHDAGRSDADQHLQDPAAGELDDGSGAEDGRVKQRERDLDPFEEMQAEEVSCMCSIRHDTQSQHTQMRAMPFKCHGWPAQHAPSQGLGMVWSPHCVCEGNDGTWQEREAARRRTREVSYNMRERVRQELAVPSVVHFYTWLLRSKLPQTCSRMHLSHAVPCRCL